MILANLLFNNSELQPNSKEIRSLSSAVFVARLNMVNSLLCRVKHLTEFALDSLYMPENFGVQLRVLQLFLQRCIFVLNFCDGVCQPAVCQLLLLKLFVKLR